jgi:hypothetical protein
MEVVLLESGIAPEDVEQRPYRSYVEECLGILMKHGTDRYGPKRTPLLVSILDVRTRECPRDPKSFAEYHRRGRRNPAGANLLTDQPTIKAMFLLSKATGSDRYARFAHAYMDYYMKNLVDAKGLFWWGWHRYHDVFTEKNVRADGGFHEIHAIHCIAWERLWDVDPEAVRRQIEAIWKWHVIDKKTGEVDRHDSGRRGCDFSMSAGAHLYAFAFLYTKTKDKAWLDRAKLVAGYHWSHRDPRTNLIPDRPNAGRKRFDGSHFVTSIPGLHCHALLKTWRLTGEALFRDYAVAYLEAYAKYGYDDKTGRFWGSLNLDGTPVRGPREAKGYAAHEPRGHLDLWEPYVAGYQYAIYAAQGYACAYRLTRKRAFLTTAERWAHLIQRELPPGASLEESWYAEYSKKYAPHGTYAGKYGRTVSFLIDMYVSTKDRGYLELARKVACEAVSKLYYKGLFRGHPAKPYYEAIDGVGFVLYALLELDAVVRRPEAAATEGTVRIGEAGDAVEVDLDNW